MKFTLLFRSYFYGPFYTGDGSSVKYKYGKDYDTNYRCVVQERDSSRVYTGRWLFVTRRSFRG